MLLKLVNYVPPAWGSPAWEAPCMGMPLRPEARDGPPFLGRWLIWEVRRAATAFLRLGLAVLADAKPGVSVGITIRTEGV